MCYDIGVTEPAELSDHHAAYNAATDAYNAVVNALQYVDREQFGQTKFTEVESHLLGGAMDTLRIAIRRLYLTAFIAVHSDDDAPRASSIVTNRNSDLESSQGSSIVTNRNRDACEGCGVAMGEQSGPGRRRQYHSDACKQAAYRARRDG